DALALGPGGGSGRGEGDLQLLSPAQQRGRLERNGLAPLQSLFDLDQSTGGQADAHLAPVEPAVGLLYRQVVLAVVLDPGRDGHAEYVVERGGEDLDLGRHTGGEARGAILDADIRAEDRRLPVEERERVGERGD